jgi:hypothetical protein
LRPLPPPVAGIGSNLEAPVLSSLARPRHALRWWLAGHPAVAKGLVAVAAVVSGLVTYRALAAPPAATAPPTAPAAAGTTAPGMGHGAVVPVGSAGITIPIATGVAPQVGAVVDLWAGSPTAAALARHGVVSAVGEGAALVAVDERDVAAVVGALDAGRAVVIVVLSG